MKIKICGFTNAENAKQAAMLDIDAVGLVFYQKSPRFVSLITAKEITLNLPPFVNSVGLFVNELSDKIDEVLNIVPLNMLQFHGDESRAACEQYGMPYLKAIHANEKLNLAQIVDNYHSASGILLDTPSDFFGGTGAAFDWSLLEKINELNKPIILAGGLNPKNIANAINMSNGMNGIYGGLNPKNIANAIKQTNPYGVDVSSGVEIIKGIKDIELIKQFLGAIDR